MASPQGWARPTARTAAARPRDALAQLGRVEVAERQAGVGVIAQVGGELRAAVSMLDRQTIADPFRPTAELVAMLRLRSGHTAELAPSPIRALSRTLWRRGERDPRIPVPSAASVPGMPTLPTRAV